MKRRPRARLKTEEELTEPIKGQELKKMMERYWTEAGINNARRPARYSAPRKKTTND